MKAFDSPFPARTTEDREFVEHLWARRKVGFLLDQVRINGVNVLQTFVTEEARRLAPRTVEQQQEPEVAGIYSILNQWSPTSVPSLAGIPLSEYIRRRRLTKAANEVLSGHDSLLDIAVRWGYGSNEAFARAFKAMHKVGPQEARASKKVLQSQQILTFKLVVEGSTSMEYRIVEKDAFQVVGRGTRVPLVQIAIVREEIGPKRKLMVDANQKWDVGESIRWMKEQGRLDADPLHTSVAAIIPRLFTLARQ